MLVYKTDTKIVMNTLVDVPPRCGPFANGSLSTRPWFWAEPEAESPKSQPECFVYRFVRSGVDRVYRVNEDEASDRREAVCVVNLPLRFGSAYSRQPGNTYSHR